jgi:putative oxidoreductase
MTIGRLLLRTTVGGFFIGHGTQKLFGWFGGHGLEGTSGFFEQLGLRPGKTHALAAGLGEAGGGALVLAGLATPLGSAAITATMLTAIHRVHLKNGPWSANGGYEYNAVLLAAAITLAEVGPGSLSLDRARGQELTGPKWAAAALAGGAIGAAGAHMIAASQPAPPAESEQPAGSETGANGSAAEATAEEGVDRTTA